MTAKVTPELVDANWFLRTVALTPTVSALKVALGVIRWALEVKAREIVVVVAGLTPRVPAEVTVAVIEVAEASF